MSNREELVKELEEWDIKHHAGICSTDIPRLADFILARESQLKAEHLKVLEAVKDAIDGIPEYWNKSANDSAMEDALYENINAAEKALSIITTELDKMK